MTTKYSVRGVGTVTIDPTKPASEAFSGAIQLSHSGDSGPAPEVKTEELIKLKVEAWAKGIEVQMHFNEMSAKARQLGLAFVAAALGLAIVILSRPQGITTPIELFETKINVVSLVVGGAILGLIGVWVLDLGHYHRLLRGSVAFGHRLEDSLKGLVFDEHWGLTSVISHYSQYDYVKFKIKGELGYPTQQPGESPGDFRLRVDRYEEDKRSTKRTASMRLHLFYGLICVALFILAVSLTLGLNPNPA